MLLDAESARGQTTQIPGTTRHVEYAAARHALKVVVVRRLRGLVPRALTWQRDRSHDAVAGKRLQIPIDGGETKSGNLGTRFLLHFARRQRPFRGLNRGSDRVALPGSAFHGHAQRTCRVLKSSPKRSLMITHSHYDSQEGAVARARDAKPTMAVDRQRPAPISTATRKQAPARPARRAWRTPP